MDRPSQAKSGKNDQSICSPFDVVVFWNCKATAHIGATFRHAKGRTKKNFMLRNKLSRGNIISQQEMAYFPQFCHFHDEGDRDLGWIDRGIRPKRAPHVIASKDLGRRGTDRALTWRCPLSP
jgi:hypothetical protein